MSTFGKGSRVEATYEGKTVHGTVIRGGSSTIAVTLDDGRGIKGSVRHFRPSSVPAPVDPSAIAWKKGMRVEFDSSKDGVVHGTIDRVSAPYLHVIADGAILKYRVPLAAARPSTRPASKDDPSPMDDWSVVGYKEFPSMSEETTAFEGRIAYRGEPVLHVKNTGTGGCNFYHGDRGIRERLLTDARAWCEQFGYVDPFEPEDTWVIWAATGKPYGQLARDFLKSFASDEKPAAAPR